MTRRANAESAATSPALVRTRGYIRESTARQGERYGPDAQRVTIERACLELGLPKASHWYTDLVTATGRVVRDELAAARRAAAAGEYDVLVCYDTSRWARNEREAFNFEDDMHRAGVRVYYASERIWSDDEAEGAAIAKGMFHVLNAQYSRTLKRKIRDGYAAKFAKHGLPGGMLPFGYRWGPDAKSIDLDPEAATIRRLVFELYGTGEYSSRSLADEMNRRGHRIFGNPFTGWTAFEILKNRIAIGITRRGDVEHEGGAPAIVDRVLFDRCQEILGERRAWRGAVRRNVFIFSSRARHAPCGGPLHGHRDRARRGVERRRLIHPSPTCGVPFARSEEQLEATFVAWLQTFKLDPRRRTRLAKFLRGETGAPAPGDVDATRRAAEQRLARAKKLFLLGDIDEKTFLGERASSQRALERSPRPRDLGVDDVVAIGELAAAWPKATLEARRAFVEQLTSEIRFDERGMELVIRPELQRAVAALAAPAVALEQAILERDELGRWTEKAAGASHVHGAAVLTCGLCWIRTSDLCDVNAAL